MKTEVNLLVEEDLLKKAEDYASEKGVSIQQLIESYLNDITSFPAKKNLLDLIREMKTETSIPDNTDLKELYFKEQASKYGF